MIVSFIVSSLFTSPQSILARKHVVVGRWRMVSGHGDLRSAGHGNHTKLSVTKLAHPPSLGGNSDDPITQRLCMTCPPTTLDPNIPIEWEGFPP